MLLMLNHCPFPSVVDSDYGKRIFLHQVLSVLIPGQNKAYCRKVRILLYFKINSEKFTPREVSGPINYSAIRGQNIRRHVSTLEA